MKRVLILILATFFVLLEAKTQSAYWEAAKSPYGGDFRLVQAPNGSLYAIEANGKWKHTYRSTDQGYTWQQLTFLENIAPGETKKTVNVTDAGSVLVNVLGSTYKTTNDGQSWSAAGGILIEFQSGVLLKYGSNGQSLQRSTDGVNWTTVVSYQGTNSNAGLVNTLYGGLLFERHGAGASVGTLYRSLDEGATWTTQSVDVGFRNFFIAPSGSIFCDKQDTIYRSEDLGVSFEAVLPNASASFAALPSGRLLAQSKELYYSDNDGVTWDTLPNSVEDKGGAFCSVRPLSDGTIFKISHNALMRSSDGGLTWQFSADKMRPNKTSSLVFVSDSSYYAATPTGLWKTNNAGETWTMLNEGGFNSPYEEQFQLSNTGGVASLQNNRFYWSADGNTFNDVTPPNGLNNNYFGITSFLNPQNGYFFINTTRGFERSIDFGQSWQIIIDSSSYHPYTLTVLSSGRIIAFDNLQQLIISDDHGDSWTSRTIAGIPYVTSIKVAPGGAIYLVGMSDGDIDASLWKSEDDGENWVKTSATVNSTLWWVPLFEIAANGHLFIAVYDQILRSVNDGLTWQTVPSPVDAVDIQNGRGNITGLAISPDQHLYVETQYFNLFKSLASMTQGVTIEGSVRRDADSDCSTADAQQALPNRPVKAEDDDFSYFTKTGPDGRYTFFLDTGSYNVSVQRPNLIWWDYCDTMQSVYLPEYFMRDTVDMNALALADCPLITVNVAAPFLRRCFDNNVYVQYCNQGTVTAESAWVDIELDPSLIFIGAAQPHEDLGNNTVRFFVGNLDMDQCGQFYFTVNVDCASTVLGQTHCITAHGFPDTLCTVVPAWSGANIEASVTCQDSIVHFQLENTGSAQSQVLDYIIIEDDVVMLQGQQQYDISQKLDIPYPANGHTLRIESQQEPGHPFSTLAIAFEEGCGGFESLGFINQFSVNGLTPSWHTLCTTNRGAFDPNDKRGFPLGAGEEHRIRPGQPIEYMIRFQNTGTDTAFTVVVRDTLSALLDPASVVPGAASHPYTWQLSGQGELSFTFANILLPDSTTNLAGSQGFVTFHIAQQPDVPLGSRILNTAAIFFDFNEPVITNETLHTVGLDEVVATKDVPKLKNVIAVSPNPAGEFVVFSPEKGSFNAHRLQLFDLLGKPVFEAQLNGNQYRLQRNKLKTGAYGWRISDKTGRLSGSGVVIFQ